MSVYRALLSIYRALLSVNKALWDTGFLAMVSRAFECVYRVVPGSENWQVHWNFGRFLALFLETCWQAFGAVS